MQQKNNHLTTEPEPFVRFHHIKYETSNPTLSIENEKHFVGGEMNINSDE